MQAREFQLTGYTESSIRAARRENIRLTSLRSTIREAIARGITLVLDQERFLHRIANVISESSGNPAVAVYVAEGRGESFALGAATAAAPIWLPKRLASGALSQSTTQIVESSTIFGAREELLDQTSVVIPLTIGTDVEGAIVIFDVMAESIAEEDLEAFSVMAEEIAPAIRVARTHDAFRNSSVRDLETGAYTYEFFIDRLEQELSRAQRSGHLVTIVLVEASDFEAFESTAGYDLADETIRNLAAGFTILMRASDVVARRGRTGFALLLPDSDVGGADVTIQRIQELLEQVDVALDERGYAGSKPGIIAGSATFPTDGQTTAALVLVADHRMLASSTAVVDGE